ncbi:MAG: NAD(P)/FAD-dependent oxidoreductase [Gemmatimonadetes bacterium]|nr:NAD(P)/FAD-dependent oxidoreductase [Gemmatimonadota bacterium]MDA1103112.1 NAD(P)/FAD-dependent oxidoreductase [Gemmatimonadota bacterium]
MNIWDAVVVGAGPAGSVAARQLALGGASVMLVDRASFPRWKVCGACVGPAALRRLEGIGLGDMVERQGAVPLDRVLLASSGRTAGVALRGTVALSRSRFDQALVDAAVAAGVDFRDGVRVDLDHDESDEEEFLGLALRDSGISSQTRARVVIDATGLGAGLRPRGPTAAETNGRGDRRTLTAPGSRIGIGATLRCPDSDLRFGELQMAVGRSGYVGLVRVEDGAINVAAAVKPEVLSSSTPAEAAMNILAEAGLPSLSGEVIDGWRGTGPLTQRPTALADRRLFRVGDGAGYTEPFTGEGMGWAIGTGVAVVSFATQAIRGWSDELADGWTREHRRVVGRSQWLGRSLAWGLRRPRLVRAAVGILGRAPVLADPIVSAAARGPRPSTVRWA